jgi:acyl phosphate:glycerol-3-phosphate acyltransferase
MPDPISWSFALPYYAAALALGYLLGSIPFGLILTRMAGLGDIRSVGSGNIGATNVLRTGNRKLAALTLLCDCLKGTLAVLIIAALGAVLGHMFPIWLSFKGGKGVATFLGAILALHWPAALVFGAVWIYCAAFVRMSSFAGLTAALAVPLFLHAGGHIQQAEMALLLTLLIWLKHHQNIRRLLKGEEPRIGQKAGADA